MIIKRDIKKLNKTASLTILDGLAKPNHFARCRKNKSMKLKDLENKLNIKQPQWRHMEEDKPTDFVSKWVNNKNKCLKRKANKLASQRCLKDKWGKRMKEKI